MTRWEQAEMLEDVEPGLHVVRVLLRMGRYQEAFDRLLGDLADALLLISTPRPKSRHCLCLTFRTAGPVIPFRWTRETLATCLTLPR